VQWHRRLGHLGYSTMADLRRSGLLQGCAVTPAEFIQALQKHVCEPCALGKLRRTSHLSRPPRPIRVLGCVHADLCQLVPSGYLGTFVDEATRFAVARVQHSKGDMAVNMCCWIVWGETQTGQRVQRVRHDRGGEYVNHTLQAFYAERGIQMEATPGHVPEANGSAERHNRRLQDIALPMLSDSAALA
jgi:hypothetical protein